MVKERELDTNTSHLKEINIGTDTVIKARIGWQGLTTKEYKDSGSYYLVTGTDFENGFINWGKCHFVNKFRYEQDKNIQLRNGDVLITKDGTIGKVGYVDELKLATTLNSGVFVVRPKKNDIDSKFLYYIFTSKIFADFLAKLSAGSTISHLYQKDFVNFNFKAPSPKEQAKIAQTLSDIDELIISLEKLISKKEDIKIAVMQQLLTGKKRLDGFSGKWEETKLGDVAKIKTGEKNNEDKIEDGLYPFFVRSKTIERINSFSFDGEAILVPGEGGIGSIFHYIKGKFDYHQRVYKISGFSKDINAKFIYFKMIIEFNFHATANSVKATVDSLRLPTFQEFLFFCPSTKDEQTAIANILSDMDSEIKLLKTKLAKTKQIKEGAMQELLTGKTRLL